MGFTLYDATIVTAKSGLEALSNILKIAEKQPNASGLPAAKLYEDMKPLTFQVHMATQTTERMVARLTRRDAAQFEDNLASFADFYARIDQVIKSLDAADKDTVNTHGEEIAPTKVGPNNTFDISGAAFANGVAIPNMYFHLSTAYGILRKEGVPLGKLDYLRSFVQPILPQ